MSFIDPNTNPSGMNNPSYGEQPQYYGSPNSFSTPPGQGNPFTRRASYRRRGRLRGCHVGCLVSLIVLIALLFGGYAAFAHTWAIFGPTTISVNAHPTLVINSQQYAEIDPPVISIHAGTDNSKMIFRVISPGNISLPWNFGIGGYQQNNDSSVIILNGDPVGGRKLDITVPANTDLKVTTNSADISVTGITGQMIFIANGGAITLTNCHVTGTSPLNDNAGAITVTQSTPDGQVTLNNNQGSIDVAFPQIANFHVNATTNSGSITSNYPGVQVQNKEIHADVGNPPRALVTLKTNAGNITLHT